MQIVRRFVATTGCAAGIIFCLALALFTPSAAAVVIDGIAAVVNGEIITLLELEKAGRLPLDERLRPAPAADRERLRREVLATILEQMVLVRVQTQRARQLGVEVSPAEIDTAIANIREDNRMSEELLARLLPGRGMSSEE